uniref:Uncharacterized protein n=1 Tax=Glossina austeni TaxID=7395 RepID=A0A1A9V7D4_GLOAU
MDKIVSITGPDDNVFASTFCILWASKNDHSSNLNTHNTQKSIITATHEISKSSNDNSSAKDQEFLFTLVHLHIGIVKYYTYSCSERFKELNAVQDRQNDTAYVAKLKCRKHFPQQVGKPLPKRKNTKIVSPMHKYGVAGYDRKLRFTTQYS